MAILPIVVLGSAQEAVLRRPSNRVRDVRERSVQRLIDDMFETMRQAPGVGLAAPQVGVPLRLVVVEKVDDAFPELVLINPEIVRRTGQRWVSEGCLSVPGYQGELFRAEAVVVKASDRNGKEIRIKAPAGSLLSQALEHEIGHIHGNLYIDNLRSREDLYPLSDIASRNKRAAPEEGKDDASADSAAS